MNFPNRLQLYFSIALSITKYVFWFLEKVCLFYNKLGYETIYNLVTTARRNNCNKRFTVNNICAITNDIFAGLLNMWSAAELPLENEIIKPSTILLYRSSYEPDGPKCFISGFSCLFWFSRLQFARKKKTMENLLWYGFPIC